MKQDMNLRTKQFAIDVWLLCSKIPHSREYTNYVNQLLRCSSSVGANFRAVGRAKSKADFINKLKIVEEEADESQFFLELILKVNSNPELVVEIERLIKEINEIIAIVVSSLKTARTS
ncbi:four helix bundle protein [Algoriphagus boseongensis]|uniref:Four helix bundle protein n=1 Tax=Algoriphagus boseongensis TaxID=1442587 RepID=A0A4R6T9R2_9BACT|nr:four helix bundle protein [Algoriphagus boseongensis]TDQ18295.1 four helix bundle protein [Algoriphagus boseongensis]